MAGRRFLGSGGGRLCPAGNPLHLPGLNVARRMVRAGPHLEKKVHMPVNILTTRQQRAVLVADGKAVSSVGNFLFAYRRNYPTGTDKLI